MLTLIQRAVLFCFVISIFSCRTEPSKISADLESISIRLSRDPLKINPIFNPSSTAREVYQYLYLPLADFDPDTKELIPILIESIPLEQKIESGEFAGDVFFEFNFKDDATWTDGSPITAEDYLFTIKAVMLPNSSTAAWRPLLGNIKSVITDPQEPRKVRVIVDGEYMLAKEIVLTVFLLPRKMHDPENSLAKYKLSEILQDDGSIEKDTSIVSFANYFNSPIISRDSVHNNGPYVLTNWVTNQSLVLKKKENYWGADDNNPFLQTGADKLIFKIIPDENTALTSLKNNDLDVMTFRSSANFKDLKDDKIFGEAFEFYSPERYSYYYLALNNRNENLSDVRVRKALAHLVDVDLIIDTIDYGYGTRTIGHFNPAKSYYASEIEAVKYDPNKAAQLLSEAGWSDTDQDGIRDKVINGQKQDLSFTLLTTGSRLTENIGLLFQDAAKKAQVKISTESKKGSVMRKENIAPRNFDIATLGITQDVAPDDPYTRWHSSMDISGGNNVTGYRSAAADNLMEDIRVEKDIKERDRLYGELQRLMHEDQPAIFLYSPRLMIAINKDFNASASSRRPGYHANTFSQKVAR